MKQPIMSSASLAAIVLGAGAVTFLHAAPTFAQDMTCGKMGGTIHTNAVARNTLDPVISVQPDYQTSWIYDPIIRVTQDLEYIPWLAREMPTQVDDLTWAFALREGITFHDGTPLDAAAAKFAIDRMASGDVLSSFTGAWSTYLDEVTVTGPLTFEIKLTQPWPDFMWTLAISSHVPSPTAVAEHGASFGVTAAVGSGPFRLDEFRPRERISVVRNEDYFMPGIPCLDGIVSTHVESGSVRSLAIQSNEMQVLNTFPESQVPDLVAHPDVTVAEGAESTLTVLLVDLHNPVLADPRVRSALQLGIDGQQAIDVVYGGEGGMVSGIFPSWHPGYVPLDDLSGIRPDAARAAELLAEAGYGPRDRLTLSLLTLPGAAHVDRGVLMQAQLAPLGIDLRVESLPNAALLQRQNAREFDLLLYQFDGGPGLGDYTWGLFGAESSGNLTGYNQDSGVQNPRAEELARTIAASSDPAAVADEIAEFQTHIMQDLPVIFVNYRNHRTAWRREVMNFSTAAVKGREDWYHVWLDN